LGARISNPGRGVQKPLYAGIDVHKTSLSVSVAEDGLTALSGLSEPSRTRRSRYRNWRSSWPRVIAASNSPTRRARAAMAIYRRRTKLGHTCSAVATSMTARRPGERIKRIGTIHRNVSLRRRPPSETAARGDSPMTRTRRSCPLTRACCRESDRRNWGARVRQQRQPPRNFARAAGKRRESGAKRLPISTV
jgi:hypothetical protein